MSAISLKDMMAEAHSAVQSITVDDAAELVGQPGVIFIDVREGRERAADGHIPGSVHAARGFLELIADPDGPMHNPIFAGDDRFVLFCASGGRSLLSCHTLTKMGITNVVNLAGGFNAWRDDDQAVEDSPDV